MTPGEPIEVACVPAGDGWTCTVRVGSDRPTTHAVRVTADDLAHLAPGAAVPDDLVRRSVAFLLDREPKESILGSFDLAAIGRYFPEYERTIRRSHT